MGIQESDGVLDRDIDHEFEGEEELATVTVVEDFDLDSFGPIEMKKQPRTMKEDSANTIADVKRPKYNSQKPKISRYHTKEAQKQVRFKQRTRRIEKAGSAGRNKK